MAIPTKPTLLQLDGVGLMVVGSKEDLFLEISVTLHMVLVVKSHSSSVSSVRGKFVKMLAMKLNKRILLKTFVKTFVYLT